jgi:demethylmenaquinone methyltransferase/2-methoxy-6-polyprenyl-1,4-benzoquinol methylase
MSRAPEQPAAAPTPGTPETEAVRAMFDRIAPRYDLLNRLLSAGADVRWRRLGIDRLALAPGDMLLDLCTGTGDVLLEWLKRDGRNRGIGIDASAEMLRRARRKLDGRRMSGRGRLVLGDAEELPFDGGAFRGAMVAFGLRNVARRERALAEVARVLRPGAPFGVLEFGGPSGLLGRLYQTYFRAILPRVGRAVSGDPTAYAYLPASVVRFPDPAAFSRSLEAAGFGDVTARRVTFGIVWLYRGIRR